MRSSFGSNIADVGKFLKPYYARIGQLLILGERIARMASAMARPQRLTSTSAMAGPRIGEKE